MPGRLVVAAFVVIACPACELLEAIGSAEGEQPAGLDTDGDDENLSGFARVFLDAHNDVRATTTPTPSPALPPLTWSSDLAATAQAWAEGCVFEHSGGDLGENLAYYSPREIDDDTSADVVASWASERADYDLGGNSCAAGEQCGHYTQIVWRDTERVGCGVADCADVDGIGAGIIWVCNYDPPGNYVGQKPY